MREGISDHILTLKLRQVIKISPEITTTISGVNNEEKTEKSHFSLSPSTTSLLFKAHRKSDIWIGQKSWIGAYLPTENIKWHLTNTEWNLVTRSKYLNREMSKSTRFNPLQAAKNNIYQSEKSFFFLFSLSFGNAVMPFHANMYRLKLSSV